MLIYDFDLNCKTKTRVIRHEYYFLFVSACWFSLINLLFSPSNHMFDDEVFIYNWIL